MRSRKYDGKVSIYQNTAGTILIEPDEDGKFSNANAVDCIAKALSLGKELDAKVTVFYGYAGRNNKRTTGSLKNDEAQILEYVNKAGEASGKPYMALLPKGKSSPVRKVKLA